MKNIVIGFLDMDYNNNFKSLPPSYYDEDLEANVIIHKDPVTMVCGDKVVTNYDIVIDGRPLKRVGTDCIYAETPHFNMRRISKEDQHLKLMATKHTVESDEYKVIERYEIDKITGWVHGADPNIKKVYLKTSDGARGLGQVVLELSNTKFKGTIHGLVADYLTHNLKETQDRFESKHGVAHELKGIENYEGESVTVGRTGYSAYEVVEDIVEELRLWTDYEGDVLLVGKRLLEEREGGYKQATYVTSEFVSVMKLNKKLLKLLKTLDLRQMSVDVFKTKTGEWGILEWQPQTGISSIQPSVVSHWHKSFIRSLVLDKLDAYKK